MEEVEAKIIYQWIWDEQQQQLVRKPYYYEPPVALTADEFGQLLQQKEEE